MTILKAVLHPLFFALLLALSLTGTWTSDVPAKTLYSYIDERGTRVITDNYDKIAPAYRAKTTAVEQETDNYTSDIERVAESLGSTKGFVVHVPGMSFEQSKIITYAGAIALLCVLAMNLSRSEAIRLLALWCLVLTGIGAPVLVYVANDGAATIMKNKAAHIQQKQQDRLSHVQ
jgi:hypothetical protein